jgi:hypothetical protein
MAYGTCNADVIGTSVAGSNIGAGNASIMKNRIINGAMVIDQRNAGASQTIGTGAFYTADRWRANSTQSSKFSVQDGTLINNFGFSNALLMTSLSAYSLAAGDYFSIEQYIEGYNIADLNWGTANAKTVTLSFWVYSSLTGTFGGCLKNGAGNRSYPYTYTISSANTWTQISVTIAGDTTGTWATTNGVGIGVGFGLGVGSTYSGTAGSWSANNYVSATGATSVVGTNGATFYITGVQLEVGSSATGFEYRQYGQELVLCQRYYSVPVPNGSATETGFGNTATNYYVGVTFPVTMRASPTITVLGTIGNLIALWSGASLVSTSYSIVASTTQRADLVVSAGGGGVTVNAAIQAITGSGNSVVASAEL